LSEKQELEVRSNLAVGGSRAENRAKISHLLGVQGFTWEGIHPLHLDINISTEMFFQIRKHLQVAGSRT
jgi:hypothetical protein